MRSKGRRRTRSAIQQRRGRSLDIRSCPLGKRAEPGLATLASRQTFAIVGAIHYVRGISSGFLPSCQRDWFAALLTSRRASVASYNQLRPVGVTDMELSAIGTLVGQNQFSRSGTCAACEDFGLYQGQVAPLSLTASEGDRVQPTGFRHNGFPA
jgi:hypothetical protein